jgi:hypothetical protein
MNQHAETPCRDQDDRPGLPRWYGPALGAVWALLLVQVMLPFPANVAVATLSAALGGFLVGCIEGGIGARRGDGPRRQGAPLLVVLLGLLGLSLVLHNLADMTWVPPLLALLAFATSCAVFRRGRQS